MKKVKSLLCVLLLLPAVASAVSLAPKSRKVDLNEFTKLVVELVPDLGVNIVFPFTLDSSKHKPPFIQRVTNKNIFNVSENKEIAGQNYITITVNKPADGGFVFDKHTYVGNLFLSVDGYHVSIVLKTTTNIKKHYTDIILMPSDKDRHYLIEKEVEHVRKAQIEEYKKKIEKLDERAVSMALAQVGSILLEKPQKKNIKEELRGKISNGETVTLFVDKLLIYQDYVMMLYEVYNNTS
ncbi:MAG: hypothetical protein OEZ01_15275, partial [Candidatus Heimdallarchaeota archaeon]|nr:hypothetical protein [Candidatus Heimdallarchaeota archaeon]